MITHDPARLTLDGYKPTAFRRPCQPEHPTLCKAANQLRVSLGQLTAFRMSDDPEEWQIWIKPLTGTMPDVRPAEDAPATGQPVPGWAFHDTRAPRDDAPAPAPWDAPGLAVTGHTPEPWTTDQGEHDQPYLDIKIRGGHHTICTIWIDDALEACEPAVRVCAGLEDPAKVPDLLEALRTRAQMMQRTRLEMAAPDLLAALQACLRDCDSKETIHPRSRITLSMATQQQARAAIAAATLTPNNRTNEP